MTRLGQNDARVSPNFNECVNVSLSMGVYLCLCLLNKAFGHH